MAEIDLDVPIIAGLDSTWILAFPRATQVVTIFLMNDYFDETRVRLYWHVEGSLPSWQTARNLRHAQAASQQTMKHAMPVTAGETASGATGYRVYYCQL